MAQDSAPGFENDILPLFRPVDVEHMAPFGVELGGPWPEEQVRLLRAWIDTGLRP
jgi:hypothetical protein